MHTDPKMENIPTVATTIPVHDQMCNMNTAAYQSPVELIVSTMLGMQKLWRYINQYNINLFKINPKHFLSCHIPTILTT
jgi:hypothetical protein